VVPADRTGLSALSRITSMVGGHAWQTLSDALAAFVSPAADLPSASHPRVPRTPCLKCVSEMPSAITRARKAVDLYGSNRDGGERLRTQMKRYAPARGMPSEPGCRPSTFGVRIDPEMLPCCPARLLSSTAGGLRAGRPADAPAAKRATLRTCNWSCVGGQEFVLVGLSADLRTKGTHFPRD
jgi:hypothetical protein